MNDVALSGWWDGDQHHYRLRVYYADTDAGGVVYHSTYLDFAERARTEMLRLLDPASGSRAEQGDSSEGLVFVVRACEIDYRRSARLDDLLEVRSRLAEIGGASFQISQEVWRGDELLTVIGLTLVCMRVLGQPTRIPGPLRERMSNYLRRKE